MSFVGLREKEGGATLGGTHNKLHRSCAVTAIIDFDRVGFLDPGKREGEIRGEGEEDRAL